jgi:uncharacterized protein (TIGR00251 family)
VKTIRIRVKPNARAGELLVQPDGSFIANLKSPPVDGKANAELIALVAAHFCLRKSQVAIKSGAASRMKRVQLDGQ